MKGFPHIVSRRIQDSEIPRIIFDKRSPEQVYEDKLKFIKESNIQQFNSELSANACELYSEAYDINKIANANKSSANAILSHFDQNPHQTLYVAGKSFLGKTRTVYEALRKVSTSGLTLKVIHGIKFSLDAAVACCEAEKYESWLKTYTDPGLLFIDDFAKKINENTALAIHHILEERTKRRKPTWMTSQLDGSMLRTRLAKIEGDDHTAEGLITRLSKHGKVILFKGDANEICR